ncbi:DUF5362 family protein [Halomarina litorea]|uniref:DUF5362 family protein n=1 Tax=Halomarina litorea TaxID=2961595 RepID=UPI0034A2FA0F
MDSLENPSTRTALRVFGLYQLFIGMVTSLTVIGMIIGVPLILLGSLLIVVSIFASDEVPSQTFSENPSQFHSGSKYIR